MKRKRSKRGRQPPKRKSTPKSFKAYRDSRGRFASKTNAVSVQTVYVGRDKLGRYRKLPAKSKPKRRQPVKRIRTRTVSLASEIGAQFEGTRTENLYVNTYPIHKTHHEVYRIAPRNVATFLARYDKRNVNMILSFVDKDGVLQHRSTQATSSGEPEYLLELFYKLLNKYATAKEITSVESVSVDVWGSIDDWGDEILGGRFKE